MKQTIVFYLYLLLSSPIWAMQITYPHRASCIESIVSLNPTTITDQQLNNITQLFKEENIRTRTWFKSHKKNVKPFLQTTIVDAQIKIFGSRKWRTNHLLSDIDAAIITKHQNYEMVFTRLHHYYVEHYPEVQQYITKTKAGLPLFILKNFSDPTLGKMKLEYAIQSPEVYTMIVTEMKERLSLKFRNQDAKTRHALEMMIAVHNNDYHKKQQLKEWTRVMPIVPKL